MVKKIILISVSSLVAIAIALLIYFFRVPISSFFTNSKYITAEEGQKLYDKGLQEGSKNEEVLNDKLDYYLSLMNNFPKLEKELQEKNIKIEELNDIISSKQSEISQLNVDLTNRNNEILLLKNNAIINSQKIAELESEAIALRSVITQKEQELLNVKTQKNELLATISYYENFIAQLETDTQTVASFEYNGSIISIQILNKGSYASISTPVDTDYLKFNYWMVDGVEVDLTTYQVNSKTKFVANLTKSYDVKFIVDDIVVSSSIIESGTSISAPTSPVKENYYFVGWTLNGIDVVDVSTYELNSNVEFKALFKEYEWEVTFISNDSVISTQVVNNREFAIPVHVNSTEFVKFKGWSLNNIDIIDVSTYEITSNCQFYAVFDYYYKVNFYVEDNLINTQVVLKNSLLSEVNPGDSKDPYKVFIHWVNQDGNVYDLTTPVTDHLNLYAIYETASGLYYKTDNDNVEYMSWNELESQQYINVVNLTDGKAFYTNPSFNDCNGRLVLDDTITHLYYDAFFYADGISELILPDTIEYYDDALSSDNSAPNLTSLVIPVSFPGQYDNGSLVIGSSCIEKIFIPKEFEGLKYKLLSNAPKYCKIFTDAPLKLDAWVDGFNACSTSLSGYYDVEYGKTLDDYYNYSFKGHELLASDIEFSFESSDGVGGYFDLSSYVTLSDIENDFDYLEINISSLSMTGSGSFKNGSGSSRTNYTSSLNLSNLKIGRGVNTVSLDFVAVLNNEEQVLVEDVYELSLEVSGGKIYLMFECVNSSSNYKLNINTSKLIINSILYFD